MKEVYILHYRSRMLYHFSIDVTDYPDKEKEVVEAEIEDKGFNLNEVSYMITNTELSIQTI